MRVRRLGFNTMVYTISEDEIPYLGLNGVKIADIVQNEQRLQLVASAVMERLVIHVIPEMALVSMPLHVRAHQSGVAEIELFMQFVNPQEVLDYAVDYDEEIDLSIDDSPRGSVRFSNPTMEETFNANLFGEQQTCRGECDEEVCDESELLILVFKTLDAVMNYAKTTSFIPETPMATLYKHKEQYYLVCDFINIADFMNVVRYEYTAVEHDCIPKHDMTTKVLLEEHGKCIIKNDAINVLSSV